MFELKNTEELYLMTLKNNTKFEGKLSCAFKNEMRTLANFHRLKNSDFILENKMVELNQNKNLKQLNRPDPVRKLFRPDPVRKLFLPWKEMYSKLSKTFYACFTESLFLRYNKISKKAVKIGGFLQCLFHIFLGHDGCF